MPFNLDLMYQINPFKELYSFSDIQLDQFILSMETSDHSFYEKLQIIH
jgi:hypothetical protein